MTWWVLTRKRIVPSYDHALITFRTSSLDHCYMAWSYHEPRRHPIIRFLRGRPRVCGYRYIWDTPFIAEQAAPGDTEHHQIQITDLIPNSTIYFYLFAPDGPYGLEIQGPLQAFVLPPPPPGPVPTPDPITFTVANPIFRCGNRYTFWANGTWYAHLPTAGGLEMHKLVGGVMMRQDQLNEPAPPSGFIHDADARMTSDATTLHISYFCRVPAPGPHLLRYATFSLTTDTWAIDEQICQPICSAFGGGETSLSLDAADRPHVAYTEIYAGTPNFYYRNRIPGTWSLPEQAIRYYTRFMSFSSAAHDPTDNTFHLLCTSNLGENFTRHRHADTTWEALTWLSIVGANLSDHSIASGVQLPHYAQLNPTWRINHHEGVAPYDHQDDLTAPTTRYASMISGPLPTAGLAIVFRDDDAHLAYIHRPAGELWQPQVQKTPSGVGLLACHYNHPDVISCLWTHLPPQNIAFYAFYAPWH